MISTRSIVAVARSSLRPVLMAGLMAVCLGACTKDPAELLQRAKEREARGELLAAIIDVKSSLQRNPNDASARAMLGRLYNDVFDYDSAEKELRRAKELGAVEGGRVVADLGRALRAQRKYNEILAEIQPSPAYEHGRLAEIHVARGRAYLLTGDIAQARAALAEARKYSADDPDVQLFDAQLLAAASDIKAAEAIVDKVLQAHPKNFEALAYKARLLRDQGNAADAYKTYGAMLAINPRHFQALIHRITIAVGLGKLDDAQKDVDAFSRIYKNHPQAYIQRGVLQLARGKPRDALESAQIALKAEAELMPAYLLAGLAHLAAGSPGQAQQALSKYLAQFPNSGIARRALAEALLLRNDSAKALETLAPLLQSNNPDPAAYAIAADALSRSGKPSQAVQYYDKAASFAPEDSRLLIRRALARIGSGQFDRGLDELAGAVEQTKSATYADEILVMALVGKKRFDEATAALDAMERRAPDNPIAANLRGVVLLAKDGKSSPAAVQHFERALKLDPAFYPAAANLAKLDLMEGKFASARKRYDQVLKANETHLAALLSSAEFDALSGNVKGSVELLRRAVKAHPGILEPKVRLATAYVALNETHNATQVVEEALATHPDEPIAFVLAANVHMQAGNVNRATSALAELAQRYQTPAAYLELARVQGWAGIDREAEGSLRKALQIRKDYLPAQLALAGFLADRGRADEALQLARAIQARHEKSAIGYVVEAEVHERQKRWNDAVRLLREALRREPGGAIASGVYRVRAKAGEAKEGLAELQQWMQKHPEDRVGQLTVAFIHLQSGSWQEAARRYESLLQRNARDWEALNGLASAYHLGRDERALRVAETAYALAPLSPHTQDTLGWILVQKGDVKRGLALLRASARSLPGNAEVRFHLATALHKSGDHTAARKELQAVLANGNQFPSMGEARALLASLK